MGSLVNGLFSNDSAFGRVMNMAYIVIVSNIMFVLCSVPIITAGASFTAMHHVILKMLHSNEMIFPVKEFLKAFKDNFKQSTVLGLLICGIAAVVYGDMRIIAAAGGSLDLLKIFTYAILFAAAFIAVNVFPVTAFFRNTIAGQIGTSLYFSLKNPIRTLLMILMYAAAAFVVYADPERRPLYAFVFFFIGFGALALVSSKMLIGDFEKTQDTKNNESNAMESCIKAV